MAALIIANLAMFVGFSAHAEMSDHEYETSLRERKRDFDRYVKSRVVSSETEFDAAAALRAARVASELKRVETEREYQRTMKRYSMEEVEKRDRQDEERILIEENNEDAIRVAFVKYRERRNEMESKIAPVDVYEESEINMAIPPESKATHIEVPSTAEKEK